MKKINTTSPKNTSVIRASGINVVIIITIIIINIQPQIFRKIENSQVEIKFTGSYKKMLLFVIILREGRVIWSQADKQFFETSTYT